MMESYIYIYIHTLPKEVGFVGLYTLPGKLGHLDLTRQANSGFISRYVGLAWLSFYHFSSFLCTSMYIYIFTCVVRC